MTRTQVIAHLCKTVGIVYNSQANYGGASDGFCEKCINRHPMMAEGFMHTGETVRYVRKAVKNQLKRDGYEIKIK